MTNQAKQKYTAEFKENVVKRATESSNVAETARDLGIKPVRCVDSRRMCRRKEAHHSSGFSRMMMRFVPQRILRVALLILPRYGLAQHTL
jgi:hypothetical protein